MEFFCLHRDRAGSTPLRTQMVEEHWTYMDGFAHRMVARGPTYADDGTLSGSLHVVDLPGPAEARAFALDEPGYQAGAYRDVLLRRWDDVLGRTMWDSATDDRADDYYLVLGFCREPVATAVRPPVGDDLILSGRLLSDDGSWAIGMATIARATDATAAVTLLPVDGLEGVEAHRWRFGGRQTEQVAEPPSA